MKKLAFPTLLCFNRKHCDNSYKEQDCIQHKFTRVLLQSDNEWSVREVTLEITSSKTYSILACDKTIKLEENTFKILSKPVKKRVLQHECDRIKECKDITDELRKYYSKK